MRALWLSRIPHALIVIVAALGLAAADTGGSMGGGDWDSGGGGGYSSSSDYSSSSSDYSSSSSDYSYDGGSSGGGLGSCAGVGVFVFVILIWAVGQAIDSARRTASHAMMYDAAMAPIGPTIDVGVLRVAIDGRARKLVQTELDRIAKSANTATAEGRRAMLREVSLLLRRVRDAWVYGGAVNEPMRVQSEGRSTFERHVDDARSRFREETVRNAQGVVTTREATPTTPRSEEGAGVILVTIVLATRSELVTVTRIGDGEELRKAIEAAGYRDANDLIAIEIIWQPSKDEDRLSSIELEAKYPHPQLIKISGALAGKIFCAYCTGPFPAELVTCPHCGAPAPGHGAA